MLSNALALAILTTTGCVIVYSKLPRRVRRLIEKYSLLTDLVALIAVYMLLGGTLTALLAGAMCGLFISILLHVCNHKEDFLILYDLRDFLKEKLNEAKDLASQYGKIYREKKEPKLVEVA